MHVVNFSTLVRPGSPNTYLVAPDGLCNASEPDRVAPKFVETAESLFEIVTTLVRRNPSFRNIEENRDLLSLRFVAVSPILRFKDDVDVLVQSTNPAGDPNSPGSTLAVYSRSRVGYSDLGANEKRVSSLLKNLETKAQTS